MAKVLDKSPISLIRRNHRYIVDVLTEGRTANRNGGIRRRYGFSLHRAGYRAGAAGRAIIGWDIDSTARVSAGGERGPGSAAEQPCGVGADCRWRDHAASAAHAVAVRVRGRDDPADDRQLFFVLLVLEADLR